VARKQIELATCGLRQITVKLWKFLFLPPTDGISGHLYVSQSVVCEMTTVQERALCVGWQRGSNAWPSSKNAFVHVIKKVINLIKYDDDYTFI
jgi:hypothetical protein